MDGERFDSIVRGIAAARSRRSLLKGIIAGTAGGLTLGVAETLAVGVGGNCNSSACDAGLTCCTNENPDRCRNLTNDAANCGNCGTSCSAPDNCTPASCTGSACGTASSCSGGSSYCVGTGGNARCAQCISDADCAGVSGLPYCKTASGNGQYTCVACTADANCPGDQCNSGICSGQNTCTLRAVSNGTTCNDGNACTRTDTCQGGVCVGGNPVVCTALDQCHVAGTCNPATGVCNNPISQDGTACNDGNACTQTDTCQGGTCVGGNPVVCTAQDQCHEAGVCDPATGQCSNPAKADGTSCEDGNLCTEGDTCQSGECQSGTAVVCTAQDQCHLAGVCDPATGECTNPPKEDDTPCSDDNACTSGDTCQAGVCQPGTAVVCTPLDICHVAGICDATSGVCTDPVAPDDTRCGFCQGCDGGECTNFDNEDPNSDCSTGSTCDGAGGCCLVQGQACSAGGQTACCSGFCVDGYCCDTACTGHCNSCFHPTPGTCTDNDANCEDDNLCTTDTCVSGTCTYPAVTDGSTPAGLPSGSVCCDGAECRPVDLCTPAACESESCNSVSACRGGSTFCVNGACVECLISDDCSGCESCVDHICTDDNANCLTCEACSGGECIQQTAGSACPSGNLCAPGQCDAQGACVPVPKDCSDLDEACKGGVCDSRTGNCTAVNHDDQTPCENSDLCNPGACQSGTCVHTAKNCGDANVCTTDSCDSADGTCVHDPITGQIDDTLCCSGEACEEAACCPPGTQHEGACKSPTGATCSGNGNCCTNICIKDGGNEGVCGCEVAGDCGVNEVCQENRCECPTEGYVVCDGVCLQGDCCENSDCDDVGQCGDGICADNACITRQNSGKCGDCESCNADYICEPDCSEDECCCPDGKSCSATCCESGGCKADSDCGDGECCCESGTCAEMCCETTSCESVEDCGKDQHCCDGHCQNKPCGHEHRCHGDGDCGKGKCCCDDGSCSKKCCEDEEPVTELPDTGSGTGNDSNGWLGALLAGGAMAWTASKLRRTPEEDQH